MRSIARSAPAMNYDSAISALYALGQELAAATPRKFDLDHMRALMDAMGHPERRFPSVLVAGTNGKGSTSATLASILNTAGYRAALYTSPHLTRVNERIQIDGQPISDGEFTEIYGRVNTVAERLVQQGALPHPPSFFETLTAMAFEYFASAGIEIAVLEVGMGGRLDATNVTDPCLAVITDIALDHQQYLGNTVAEIAREKAGIIRRGGVVVTLPQHPAANDVIGHTCLEREARAVSAAPYVPNVSPGASVFEQLRPTAQPSSAFRRSRYFLEVLGEEVLVETPLLGRHQLRNVALAIAAAVELKECGFPVTAQQIAEGVRETAWPGRFQQIHAGPGMPEFIVDVAHNPAGAWALRSALSEYLAERPITMVFGAMRDKAVQEMAEILFPVAEHVVLTQAHTPRAATPQEMAALAERVGTPMSMAAEVKQAIAAAAEHAGKSGVVVVAGSIYVAGEALAALGAAPRP